MVLSAGGLRVALYRHRAVFGRRRGGYMTLVLLIGLVGGLALGSVAAARRTQGSFAAYLASTNPSDLGVSVYGGGGYGGGGAPAYSAAGEQAVARLAGIKHVEVAIPITAAPYDSDGAPELSSIKDVQPVASVDGLYFDQDRLAVVAGRLADPRRQDEVVMTVLAAHLLGVHVGEVIHYGIYSSQQQNEPGFGTAMVRPYRQLDATLVGLVQVNGGVVEDDIDRYPTFEFFTPALGHALVSDPRSGPQNALIYGLQLDRGILGAAAAEREFTETSQPQSSVGFHALAGVELKVDRTIKPVVIALGVFGGVALLAGLLITVQLISRQLVDAADDLQILRAFGADATALWCDGLLGIGASVVGGSLLAAVVAVALSPLSPLGPVRAVYPEPGIVVDWTVLGIGAAVLVVVLGFAATVMAWRAGPHRSGPRSRSQVAPLRPSRTVQTVASIGLPLPTLVGVRFALERGRDRTAVPVRSTILGAVLSVALVVATLTFGGGLQSLVSHPALYGWNFTYLLNPSNTVPPKALTLLNHDPDVAGWSGYDYNVANIDGQGVPFLLDYGHNTTKAAISPPILTGHAVQGDNEIVLGAATLAQLHTHLGGTVHFSYGSPQDGNIYVAPQPFVVVGTATMPAVGFASAVDDHTSMGTGGLISVHALPKAFREVSQSPIPALDGPNLVFVRLRAGVAPAAGRADMKRVATAADRILNIAGGGADSGDNVSVLGVQRPAEIVNYGTVGLTPVLMALALGMAAFVALGLTLTAAVRRRRRDLALFKSLGFTRRQLATAVTWQATVSSAIGVLFGTPIGIAAGRTLWTLFAREIFAVPQPTVPVLAVILVALGAVLLANLVAAVPGRMAARTPTALLLSAE